MRSNVRRRVYAGLALAVAVIVPAAAGGSVAASAAATTVAQSRAYDPVVVGGAAVPALLGVPVGDIVAFRWANAWAQVPVQVDQRKVVELNTVYGQPANTSNRVNVVVYADPNTYTGAGSGVLGTLDEIAFMARDTGAQLPPAFSEPASVVHNSGARVKVVDPLTGASSFVFLFRRAGTTLSPGAGRHYVNYTFRLLSGAYKTTYHFTTGPNPENSTVSSPFYSRHFGDRWLDDKIVINAGTSTRVDILDRHKALFAPGNCGRSEDTFDSAEGAFIANINGPVRAIRSYMGANSGPYTVRTHLFYERREDVITDLRVHPIPGIMNYWDYSPAASGMRYTNDLNTTGVVVDGTPDTVNAGTPQWEKIDGAQGSLTHVNRLFTSISGITGTNYYADDSTVPNPVTQCTGDQYSYGSSGSWINTAIAGTDPHLGYTDGFHGVETLFYEAPGQTVATAQNHNRQVSNPPKPTASAYTG